MSEAYNSLYTGEHNDQYETRIAELENQSSTNIIPRITTIENKINDTQTSPLRSNFKFFGYYNETSGYTVKSLIEYLNIDLGYRCGGFTMKGFSGAYCPTSDNSWYNIEFIASNVGNGITLIAYLYGTTYTTYRGYVWKENSESTPMWMPVEGPMALIVTLNTSTALPNCILYKNLPNANQTGIFKVVLPLTNSNPTMAIYNFYIYDYSSLAGSQILVSGYTYNNSNWYNYKKSILGSYSYAVRLAYDSNLGRYCILFGTTTTSWQYPIFCLKEIIGGYGGSPNLRSIDNYSVTLTTSEANLTNIVTL